MDGRVNNGGARPGSGRPRKPIFVQDEGLSPLELMLSVMRDTELPMGLRLDTANKAAPYCHARMVVADVNVDTEIHVSLIQYADRATQPAIEGVSTPRLDSNGAGSTPSGNGVAKKGG